MKAIGKTKPAPELYADSAYIWSLFVFASDTRTQGDPISAANIESLLNLKNIYNTERREMIADIIHLLDAALMKHYREKEKLNNA